MPKRTEVIAVWETYRTNLLSNSSTFFKDSRKEQCLENPLQNLNRVTDFSLEKL